MLYLTLAKRWAKERAILFDLGAVSGTVLSFELGSLWPRFMQFAGSIIGIPFSLEGFAFFAEAIFLGLYLYGWDRLGARAHLCAGLIVAVSGAASAIFVTMVNAWMNTPTGFELASGQLSHVDPIAGMLSPAALPQSLHMVIAAYAATGFAVAGIHAARLLREALSVPFHERALAIALAVGAPGRRNPAASSPVTSAPRLVARTFSRSNWRRSRDSSLPSAARRCASAASRTWSAKRRPTQSRFRAACLSLPTTMRTPGLPGSHPFRASSGLRWRSST